MQQRSLQSRSSIHWLFPASLGVLALTACVSPGLNTGGVATKFNIEVVANVDNTDNHQANHSFSISASCRAGGQLVGGGYRLISNNNEVNPRTKKGYPILVVIEGNYPSARDTWTVQARNPDNTSLYSGDKDVVVIVVAYCVTSANYDLDTEIREAFRVASKQPSVTTPIDVRCSKTSAIALSGGFLLKNSLLLPPSSASEYEAYWPGLHGSGIVASYPLGRDESSSAMGWRIEQAYTPALYPTAPQVDIGATAYLLCARRNIIDEATQIVPAIGTPTVSSPSVLAPCGQGEFTVGGGYRNVPWTLPSGQGGASEIDGNLAAHSPFSFSNWEVSGDTLGFSIDSLALCVHIPQI